MKYIDKIFNILKKRYEAKRLIIKKISDTHIAIYLLRNNKLIVSINIDYYSRIMVCRFTYVDSMETHNMYNSLHLLRFLDAVSFGN